MAITPVTIGDHVFFSTEADTGPADSAGRQQFIEEHYLSWYWDELPYQEREFIIVWGGFTHNLVRVIKSAFRRIGGIDQFGAFDNPLNVPVKELAEGWARLPFWMHTRGRHTLQVEATVILLARRLGLNKRQTNTLRFLALTHDIFTSIVGDDLKTLNRVFFDEDRQYRDLLNVFPELRAFIEEHGVDYKMACEILAGQHELSWVHKLADWSYVANDLSAILGDAYRAGGSVRLPYWRNVSPRFGAVWESAVMHHGEFSLFDDDAALELLRVRAHQILHVYCSPKSRGPRRLVSQVMAELAMRLDLVSAAELARGRSQRWWECFLHNLGINYYSLSQDDGWSVWEFDDAAKAKRHALALLEEGHLFVGLEHIKPPKAGTNIPTLHTGKVAELRTVRPDETAEIERIVSDAQTSAVYLQKGDCGLSREYWETVRSLRRSFFDSL